MFIFHTESVTESVTESYSRIKKIALRILKSLNFWCTGTFTCVSVSNPGIHYQMSLNYVIKSKYNKSNKLINELYSSTVRKIEFVILEFHQLSIIHMELWPFLAIQNSSIWEITN